MVSSDQSLIDAALEEILGHREEERNEGLSKDVVSLLSFHYLAKVRISSENTLITDLLYSG